MSNDALTRDEIESLLVALDARASQEHRAKAPRSSVPNGPRTALAQQDTELSGLEARYQTLARTLGSQLADLLRAPCDVRLAGLEQSTYGKFTAGIKSPACSYVLRAAPLERELVLDLAPGLVFAATERLLGGHGAARPAIRRPLSTVELGVAARIVNLMLHALGSAWHDALPLEPALVRSESDPTRLCVAPASASSVVACWEIGLGEATAEIALCTPSGAFAPLAQHPDPPHDGEQLLGANLAEDA